MTTPERFTELLANLATRLPPMDAEEAAMWERRAQRHDEWLDRQQTRTTNTSGGQS